MAENDNQNNLENSVRSMISDRIKKLREESAKKTEAIKSEALKKESKPDVKTENPVIGKASVSKPAAGSTGSTYKKAEAIKTAEDIKKTATTSASQGLNTDKKTEIKTETKPETAAVKSEEELKKAAAEEAKKQREAEKEEQRKIREAEKEEKRKLKEAEKAEKAKEKELKKAEKERLREEKIAAAEEEYRLAETKEKEAAKVTEAAAASATVSAAGEAVKADESETKLSEAGTVDGADENIHEKGDGVWKSFVGRMNSEAAGDDVMGRDIEDESVDQIFYSPEEKKRKRTLGFVKLYVTLGAIAAIAIIIAFFTVRNNSFRHIYERGVQAYNEEDYDSAIDTFEKLSVSAEGEHNIDVLNYLAQCYIKKDRYEDALNVYNRALQTDPTFGPAVTGLCEMYTKMGDGKALNATLDKYRGTNMEEYIADYMVSNPTVNPDAGKYEEDLEIAITGDQNVPIFYTLDGSEPNSQSTLYSKPIKASEGTTQIKAISINTLGIRSGIIDKSYTVEYRIPNEPKIALNSGIYVTGQTVTISGDEGCDIYYTTDGSTPTKYSDKYEGPLRLIKGNVILTAVAISNHDKVSPITSKNYIIVQNASELEKVEQMNQPTTVSTQVPGETQEGESLPEGYESETAQNPNETEGWYTEESTGNEEEGLFDWLLNDRSDRNN